MKTMPDRCDDSPRKVLLGAERSAGVSAQRLFDNFVTHVISEPQAEARFVARQKRDNPACGWKRLAEIRRRIASPAERSRRFVGGNFSCDREPSSVNP